MKIEVNLLHPLNDPPPIEETEVGISIEVKLLQLIKAQSPIVVTELGISIEAKFLQSPYLLLSDYQYSTL